MRGGGRKRHSDSSSTAVILGSKSSQSSVTYPVLVASTDIVHGARRVLIYGVTGSGKTTLAARLSGITGLRWHSVDDLTWQPGWVEVPTEQQRSIIHDICQESEWILDSAYSKWLDEPLGRAELIVALDYRRWVSLQRLVRRTIAQTRRRPAHLQREPRDPSPALRRRLDPRLAFQVVRTQARPHPAVDDRPERTARPSPDVGTSDGAMVGERRPQAQRALTGPAEPIWLPTFRPGQPWVRGQRTVVPTEPHDPRAPASHPPSGWRGPFPWAQAWLRLLILEADARWVDLRKA